MDGFYSIIKNKVENYKSPYDNSSWKKFKKKLPNKNIKYKNTKYIIYSIITILLITSGIFYYNYKPINLTKTIVETKIPIFKEIYLSPIEVKKEVATKFKTNSKEIIPLVENNIEIQLEEPIFTDVNFEEELEVEELEELEEFLQENKLKENEELYIELKLDSVDDNSIFIDTTIVVYTPTPTYYLPNAFTPNNDGKNDEFNIIGTNLEYLRYKLMIYNRWGELVFESVNPDFSWDGKNNIKGVYVWILSVQDDNGKWIEKQGTVTLIKK